MNQIYVYDGAFQQGDRGWDLVRAAATRFGSELNLAYDFEAAEIQRTEKGKPFFVDIPVSFSLSHSGMMWMCLFAQGPCGLDLQIVESRRDWQAISSRQYTREEQHYVELWGIEGFYEIWVRKEAFGKCTGQGIFGEMPSMVDERSDLKPFVEFGDVTYHFGQIHIAPEMKCAYCVTEQDMEPELRILG